MLFAQPNRVSGATNIISTNFLFISRSHVVINSYSTGKQLPFHWIAPHISYVEYVANELIYDNQIPIFSDSKVNRWLRECC